MSNKKLRDAAKLIELGKICDEKVKLLKEQVDSLNERIAYKDGIIKSFGVKDTSAVAIINTYKSEVANLTGQRDVAIKAMNDQNKLMRRQKRKTAFAAIAGPILTAAAFIYFKK